jgi:hypothetical protein
MREIKHDGESRITLFSKVVCWHHVTCAFCGRHNAKGKLFIYGVRNDDNLAGRINWSAKAFCSISCYRSYSF